MCPPVQSRSLDICASREHHEGTVLLRHHRRWALISVAGLFAASCSEDGGGSGMPGVETPTPGATSGPSSNVPAPQPSSPSSSPAPADSGGPTGVSTEPAPAAPSGTQSGGAGGQEPTSGSGGGGAGGVLSLGEAGAGGGGEPAAAEREFLSQTGLFADIATETLGERVVPFAPQFTLWTDGATKRRWLHIPEGTQIDTSDVDEWEFPVGTKVWKEFTRGETRIETRLLEKLPPERASEGFEGWLAMAYVWNEEQTDAVAAPMGQENAKGTEHDVPDQEACGRCHDMRVEKPLGVSAVQLNHDGEGSTLQTLADAGWLSDPPATDLTVPGDDVQREVLGYLHANCGHCHRQGSPVNSRVSGLRLWLESDSLSTVEQTQAYQALVNQYTESGQGSTNTYRVVPGDPDSSELMRRITLRQGSPELEGVMPEELDVEDVPMPPLGTELPDEEAVELVRSWILSLPVTEP